MLLNVSIRIVIFANGIIADYATLAELLRPTDYLIAADGGTRHCLAIGRRPDVIVGDLDSIDADSLRFVTTEGVHIERHSPTKAQTDLELALDYALKQLQHQVVSEILLFGITGGRLDQMLGNVLILAQRDWPVPVILVDGLMRAQIVRPGVSLTLSAAVGTTVSALPLSDTVTGITYTGMQYPLANHTLHIGSTRGMSNVVNTAPATVQITSGRLLVIEMGPIPS